MVASSVVRAWETSLMTKEEVVKVDSRIQCTPSLSSIHLKTL